MTVKTEYISISTKGNRDVIDVTSEVRKLISVNKINSGIVTIFAPGSTAGITTIEFEPGLKKDIDLFLERIIPYKGDYFHHETWHDDNGSSHLQAAMIGPSLTVPIVQGEMTLGTWQQIVVVDCDTRPRTRKITAQFLFE